MEVGAFVCETMDEVPPPFLIFDCHNKSNSLVSYCDRIVIITSIIGITNSDIIVSRSKIVRVRIHVLVFNCNVNAKTLLKF